MARRPDWNPKKALDEAASPIVCVCCGDRPPVYNRLDGLVWCLRCIAIFKHNSVREPGFCDECKERGVRRVYHMGDDDLIGDVRGVSLPEGLRLCRVHLHERINAQ